MIDYYSINTTTVSIEDFKRILQTKKLLKSRLALLENIEGQFFQIAKMGIISIRDLSDTLKTKRKIQEFSDRSEIDETYLSLLKRELGSYEPKPVRLDKFPDVDLDLLTKLEADGVVNSKALLNRALEYEKGQLLRGRFTGKQDAFIQLIQLCDLCRLPGVGSVFAVVLWQAGVKSVNEFVRSSIKEVYENSKEVYEKLYPKGADYRIEDLDYVIEQSRFMRVQIPEII